MEEMKTITVGPDEFLLVQVPKETNQRDVQGLRTQLASILGPDVMSRVIMTTKEVSFTKIRLQHPLDKILED